MKSLTLLANAANLATLAGCDIATILTTAAGIEPFKFINVKYVTRVDGIPFTGSSGSHIHPAIFTSARTYPLTSAGFE